MQLFGCPENVSVVFICSRYNRDSLLKPGRGTVFSASPCSSYCWPKWSPSPSTDTCLSISRTSKPSAMVRVMRPSALLMASTILLSGASMMLGKLTLYRPRGISVVQIFSVMSVLHKIDYLTRRPWFLLSTGCNRLTASPVWRFVIL